MINFVVEFTAGGFGAFDIVVDFHAVENERDFISDNGCLGGLPLVSGFGDKFVGRLEVVDGAVAVDGIGSASVIAKDLDFVAAAQIEATVGFVGDHELEFNDEVPKFVVSDEIVAMKVFVGGVLENAVFDRPTIAPVGMAEMPPCGVFAIEERAETLFTSGMDAEGGSN